jgi:hypothetical protein
MRSTLPVALLAALLCAAPSPLGGQAPQVAGPESVTTVEWAELAFVAKDRAAFRVDDLPESIRRLEGKLIRVRGYFHAGSVSPKAREFVLIGEVNTRPTVSKFGAPPEGFPIHQLAAVEMAAAKKATVTVFQPVAVTARLTFKVITFDGQPQLVYHLVAESVQPVKPRPGYHPALTSGC